MLLILAKSDFTIMVNWKAAELKTFVSLYVHTLSSRRKKFTTLQIILSSVSRQTIPAVKGGCGNHHEEIKISKNKSQDAIS